MMVPMLEQHLDQFARQHALATTGQLGEVGLDAAMVQWMVRGGRLAWVSPRVLRLVGAPATEAQRVMAAVLDAGPGAVLSHTAALAWWKVPGFTLRELHVTHPRDAPRRKGWLADFVHRDDLPEPHRRSLDSVPVVSPVRALFELAGMPRVPLKRVERAVDSAWSLRLVSGSTLHALQRELAGSKRPGLGTMRQVLAVRGPGYVPPASGLEGRVIEILRGSSPVSLRRQVDTGDDEGWIGRIDFADPELPFRLEVQSERFHTSLVDSEADTRRHARLRAAGFVVVTVTETDVWHHPDRVVDVVRAGRYEANLRRLRGQAGQPTSCAARQPSGAENELQRMVSPVGSVPT
jgi:hypothetical protein